MQLSQALVRERLDRRRDRKADEADAGDPFVGDHAAQPAAQERAADRADAVGAEQDAVEQRAALDDVARHQRQQRQRRDRRDAEDEAAQQHLLDVGRHGDVAQPRRDGEAERLARQRRGRRLRLPAKQHDDQRDVADGVGREGRRRAGRRDDRAADRRADAARQVEAHRVQRHRRRHVRARHHVADGRLPGRVVERRAAADQEGEGEEQPGRHDVGIGGKRQRHRDDEHEALRDQHDRAAVEIVGKRSRHQREQHDRQGGRGLHQRDEIGRLS